MSMSGHMSSMSLLAFNPASCRPSIPNGMPLQAATSRVCRGLSASAAPWSRMIWEVKAGMDTCSCVTDPRLMRAFSSPESSR